MSYPIGIDLGTTNSVACVYRRGQIETIAVENRAIMPSAISVLSNGQVLVGMQAKSRAMIDPENSVTSAKRYIGDGKTQWQIGKKSYTPLDVSSLVIKKLKESAEAFLKEPVTQAVVTVPAYFNNYQKQDTKKAAEAAGLNVLQLLPEPTAAAISYGLDKGKDQTIMVYDLGGGTFDVSILEVNGNHFKVMAVDGDFHLGGDDFDLLVVEHLVEILQKKTKQDLGIFRALFSMGKRENVSKELLLAKQQLKEVAEKAKKELSESETTLIQIPNILGTSLDEEISLKTYNRLITPLVDKTIAKMSAVLKAANMKKGDIDRVILVGGSTRNRLVKERVAETIKEPFISERVDEVVAQGAGIVAGYLSSPEEDALPIEFHNVTPFSLGVCAFEEKNGDCRYFNSIIIPKNSQVPCVKSKQYQVRTKPKQNNQLYVYMLQGEDDDPTKCLMIGKYVFSGITHVPDKPAIIEIEYGYDVSGIITVAAKEISTGKELALAIQPTPEGNSWLAEVGQRSPYTMYAGQHKIPEAVSDRFGNPLGTQYDLAKDQAFKGYTIAVLHLYTGEGFDFKLPESALKEKGFALHRWTTVPSVSELDGVLRKACQLWLISDRKPHLQSGHIQRIREFFESGRGVYIWGDNDPYYADANTVATALLKCTMSGNVMGDQTVTLKTQQRAVGFESHLITTGLQYVYEGITIATISNNSGELDPLIYGSAGNLVTAVYERNGKRAIVDGGFTRLLLKWDTAGTGRYVKNAASWLVNYERFGY